MGPLKGNPFWLYIQNFFKCHRNQPWLVFSALWGRHEPARNLSDEAETKATGPGPSAPHESLKVDSKWCVRVDSYSESLGHSRMVVKYTYVVLLCHNHDFLIHFQYPPTYVLSRARGLDPISTTGGSSQSGCGKESRGAGLLGHLDLLVGCERVLGRMF